MAAQDCDEAPSFAREIVTLVTLSVPLRRVLDQVVRHQAARGVCTMKDWEVRERATAGEVVLVYLKGIAFAVALMNVLEYLMWLYGGWK